jgi:diguanylate cyclase (GGDEF)-like protein
MFDLDNFKKLNDSRGHLEGDRVLIKAAALVKETLREMDVAARYGGEEFALVLPDTSRTGAHVVAERIRRRIEERFRRRRGGVPVTVSGGVACYPDDAASVEELIQRADQALYRSKAGGKNRITLAEGERRRHLRVPLSARVVVDADRSRRIAARALNVSQSGLLVSVPEPLPVGSNVNLLVRRSGAAHLDLRGEVVRVTAHEDVYDLGVRVHGDAKRQLLVLSRRAGNA